MSLLSFSVKYLFRTLHMGTYALIFGNMAFDYMFGKRTLQDKRQYTFIHIISCVVLMLSGLINMIILVKDNQYVKNLSYQTWKYVLMLKFFLTLSLTPLLEKLYTGTSEELFKIRFSLTVLLLLLSPLLRYFRESNLIPGKLKLK